MALALVEVLHGPDAVARITEGAEYVRNGDPDNDPFAVRELS